MFFIKLYKLLYKIKYQEINNKKFSLIFTRHMYDYFFKYFKIYFIYLNTRKINIFFKLLIKKKLLEIEIPIYSNKFLIL
ncbi:hypothetical protein BpHYR1_024446 [Brachionus plicatilis]|uniref:Uncharacterized protein n=1 Tax=Brachionus plicatilis TaxID=10195 RepID=A0A3M7SB53_BRAPC|nr:hypothetical protein BpHYR1_024446 [Brachionus plicatilis]